MSLEFEKLLHSIDRMAQIAAGQRRSRLEIIKETRETLDQYAANWAAVDTALEKGSELADPKYYRSAKPVDRQRPLNAAVDAPPTPAQATLIATDGSQIMPDRHASHLYYLINIGGIIFYHGEERPPDPFSIPQLTYPSSEEQMTQFVFGSGDVSIERDLKEIGTLADKAWQQRDTTPFLLALLDQRLLYWPIIGGPATPLSDQVRRWLSSMTKIQDSGASLAGYIDRPMTSGVITLLRSLQALDEPDFDWKSLGHADAGGGMTDAALFSQILGPGQRSKVFSWVSPANEQFAEEAADNEVCFFYLNPGKSGERISRVDIPLWVARNEAAVDAVHGLIYDQCQILGDYPYVIARADEMAVIGRQDHEELNFMIDLYMQRYDVSGELTAKQDSKGLARGGKTRHGI